MGAAGSTPTNLLGRHIIEDTAAGTNYRIGSDVDAWSNEAVSGYPDTVTNLNRRCYQLECGILHIMRASTEVAFLRNYALASDVNFIQTV